MNNLISLNSSNFQLSPQKTSMLLKKQGIFIVFFKSTGCGACRQVEPTFLQVVKSMPNVGFGICDVHQDQNVLKMNSNTNTNFTGIPQFFAYNNGVPFAKYSGGDRSFQSLQNFVAKAAQAPPMQSPNQAPPQQFQQPQQPAPRMRPPQPPPNPRKTGGYATLDAGNYGNYDDNKLMMPDGFIPHNAPWDAYNLSE